MRLLFRQRVFSWFDSYDIYDENEQPLFTVQGRLSWGHRLEISDATGNFLGTVQEAPLTLMPRFTFYIGEEPVGELRKAFTLLFPHYELDCNGWQVDGNLFGWDYTVTDEGGREIMLASKELFHWSDFYVIDVASDEDVLMCLMIVLAIDAANCDN